MSSIAFRASTGAVVTPAATSIALSNPTGTANDDILIVALAQNTTGTLTFSAPAGWTQIGSTTKDGGIQASMWWKRWQTGDPTSHTFTSSLSGQWAGAIAAYSGVHTTAPIHVQASAIEGTLLVGEHTSPAITTTVATWLINAFFNASSAWTPPPGETEREDRSSGSAGSGTASVEFCDSSGDRASGSQPGKTASSNVTTPEAVMFQMALEPAPEAGGGTRTSKARIFRSTQTAPNATTVRDLDTAFGTGANAATSARYLISGTVTWFRWNPNSIAATAQDPANVTTASGQGWRDAVAENTAEQVRYAAGTWTVRVRLTKTGQTIAADITVRVTVIVYRVTSAGAHVAEIGRATSPDTVLSTATLSLLPSFTTDSSVTFDAGDKIQVECYVTPIVAGAPSAPAATVHVNFLVDETSANSGASFTAIPAYKILYARALSVTGVATVSFVRKITGSRSLVSSGSGAVGFVRRLALARVQSVSGEGIAGFSKFSAKDRSYAVSGAGSVTTIRRLAISRSALVSGSAITTIGRSLVMSRGLVVAGSGIGLITRALNIQRSFSVVGASSPIFGRNFTFDRTLQIVGSGSILFQKQTAYFRSYISVGSGAVGFIKSLMANRSITVTASGVISFIKSLIFDRKFSVTGSAQTKMRIEMPQAVLNRIQGGGEAPVLPADIAAIANAVWDESTVEQRAAGSYGILVSERLDVVLSSRASAVAVAALGSPAQASEVGTLLDRLTATRAAALDLLDVASSTRASAAALNAVHLLVDDLEARLSAARALLLDNLDVPVSTRATPANAGGGTAIAGEVGP